MKKVTSILTTMLLLCFPAYSQDASLNDSLTEQKSDRIEISFDLNSYVVNPDFSNNKENLKQLAGLINRVETDTLLSISEIKINSYASPDGGRHHNEQITKNRANSIYNYLVNTLSVPDSLITKKHSGVDWNKLYTLVEESDMEYKESVLDIIQNTPEEVWRKVNPTDKWLSLVDSRVKRLQDLKYGNPYRYMSENFFSQLRIGSVVTIYFEVVAHPIIEEATEFIANEEADTIKSVETAPISEQTQMSIGATNNTVEDDEPDKKPLFAIKTNLLYDIALMPSIELEVPIGERWSVAGEWIFPWWITKDNGNALQMLSGQVEGRYWFGERATKPQLTGWFAGLYAGGGLYDLQWKNNGYQGEFYIAAGLSGGFAHTINKSGSLRMEYSLGVGYLNTEYRYYEGMQNNEYLVWQHDGKYTWFGPTKAKVSLVWMINKRGGKR